MNRPQRAPSPRLPCKDTVSGWLSEPGSRLSTDTLDLGLAASRLFTSQPSCGVPVMVACMDGEGKQWLVLLDLSYPVGHILT